MTHVSTERKRICRESVIESVNQSISQSVSDSRGTGLFKLLKVEELLRTGGRIMLE